MEVKVTITERCTAQCTSCLTPTIKCPQDMTFETWKNIVDGVARIGLVNKFHFYGFGESMIHKDIQKFIDYAIPILKSKNITSVLTTNGSVDLTRFDLSGMDEVIVSFNAFSKAIYEEHIKLNWDKVLANIKKIADVRRIQLHILNYNKETVMEKDLEATIRHKNIRTRVSTKVDNQLGEFYEDTDIERVPCSYVLELFSFNANGDLVLCAHDFHSQVVYGNINDVTMEELFMRKKGDIRRHKNEVYEGLCKNCNFNKKTEDEGFVTWI